MPDPAPFRFHDSLTNRVRDFVPLEPGVVRMYNCGPTVYSSPQIGNHRSWMGWDVLRRALELGGWTVHQVMNITDVGHLTNDEEETGDDKLEAQAKKEKLTAWQVAEKYTDEFFAALAGLNMRPAEHYPKATDHIPEMLEIIERLVEQGDAYVTESGNVYYSVERFSAYGALSKNSVEDLVAGARVDVVDEKRNPIDFALWKRDPDHQMQWDAPWGRGFPGWHIECSAMSRKYLGDTLDIHTGGEDNVFPHHECEIAQSESFTGKPFVRYWLHNRHLLVDGKKMSKSSGTMYTFADVLERGFTWRALRYLLLSIHYRLPMNFTWDALSAADTTVKRLDTMVRNLASSDDVADSAALADVCASTDRDFLAALGDDLNVSEALAAVHRFRAEVNQAGTLSPGDLERVRATIGRIDAVLGLKLLEQDEHGASADDQDDAAIDALVAERQAARAAKDWARADEIRDRLTSMGITLEDTADGVRWFRE